jgi:hypothetical protein
MEYDPEIVVDELTFFFTWFIGRHYDEAIYNSDTYLRTSNKYVRGWDKGILHCSAVVQVFFFPKEGQGLKHYIFCRSTCFAQWKSEYICPAILQHGWKITHLSMIYHFFSIVRFNYDW